MSSPASAYEAGTGGKFRKRPLRRHPATPYDRPPSAARALRVPATAEKNHWISRFVDPASRIIGLGASRFFSSVFRNRLGSPLGPAEENIKSDQEVNAAVSTITSLEEREQGGNDAENKTNNSNFDGAQQNGSCYTDGIFEIEQLLNQKTFTRAEYKKLSELVRSRTVEPSTLHPSVSCERREHAKVLEQENGMQWKWPDGDISTSAVKPTVPTEEFKSVEDLAKAYMGSRHSKVPSSALSSRNQTYMEDTNLPYDVSYGKKGSNLPTEPSSLVRFSGTPKVPENGYMTPKSLGRSAMHRMSCSPFFKASSSTNFKGGEHHSNRGPSASPQSMFTHFMYSGGKQVHKRQSSVLDADSPIRRIRQKCNLISPSMNIRSIHTPSPVAKDTSQWSASPSQKPLPLDGPKDGASNLQHVENGDTKPSPPTISPQPSQIERNALQELDKLVTSSNEKSFKPRSIARDELPSRLTVNMLHERALQSIKDIDSSKFLSPPGNSYLDPLSSSNVPSFKSSNSWEQLSVVDNVPSKPAPLGVKVTQKIVGKSVTTTTGADPGLRTTDFAMSGSTAVPLPKKPAFQMTAPEGAWELDDDDSDTGEASKTLVMRNDKLEPKETEGKISISETGKLEKSLEHSFESVPTSGSILGREAEKATNRPAAGRDTGFSFHPATAPVTSSPSLPRLATGFPLIEILAPQEEVSVPGFVVGCKESHSSSLPTTMTRTDCLGNLKSNASDVAFAAPLEGLDHINGGNRPKDGDTLRSSENAASSTVSTLASPALAAFGASTTSSLSNGSFASSSSTFFASTVALHGSNSVTSSFPVGATASSFLSCSSISSAPIFPTVSSSMESTSTALDGIPMKASPLSTTTAISSGASAFSNTSSSLAPATLVSSSTSSAPSSVTAPLFSSPGISLPALSMASASSKPGNAIFPAQSTFGTEATQAGKGIPQFSSDSASQFSSFSSSPASGLSGFSSSASPIFGSSTSSASKGFTFQQSNATSSSQPSTSLFGSFAQSAPMSSSSAFGSSTTSASTGLSVAQSAPALSSQPSTPTIFGSTTSSPSTGFIFGHSAPASGSQASSSPVFGSTTFGQSPPASVSQPSSSPVFGSTTFGQSAPASVSQPSSSPVFGSTTFGQSAPALSSQSSSSLVFGSTIFGQSAPASGSQPSSSPVFGSTTFGQSAPASSSQPSSSPVFGSTTFGQSAPVSGSQASPSPVFGSTTFGQSALALGSQPSSSPVFGLTTFGQSTPASGSQPSSSPLFGSTTFGQSAPATGSQPSSSPVFGSTTSSSAVFPFGQSPSSSAQPSTSSIFGSSPASTPTGFSFGQSAPTSGSSFIFGPSSGSAFGFKPAGTTTSPTFGFSSGSPGGDQMNVEDGMADDTSRAAAPPQMVHAFGQPGNPLATTGFFGAPAVPPGGQSVFQFGSQTNPSVTQGSSSFQAGGNLEFSGGSFSLGSTGGDKSGRKIVKINRNKHRKK